MGENEKAKDNIEKKSFLKYIISAVLILFSIGIVFFVCRNIYFSRMAKPNDAMSFGNSDAEKIIELTNVSFNSSSNTITIKKTASLNFNINNIKINDEYDKLKFSFVLDKDYLSSFIKTEYDFKNEIFNGLKIINNNSNQTQLIIYENDIYGYKITEDNQNYYIVGGNPKDIYENIVVIDAGHGGKDPGCENFGYNEKSICLDIALKTEKYINDKGNVKVFLTRKDDTFLKLGQRVDIAEKLGDIFISIHINSNDQYPNVSGTEVYYYDKSFDKVHYITGNECAEFLCNSISMKFGSKRRENKTESYEVISTSNIPSVLCEVGFLSNKAEADKLNSDDGKEKIAQGIAEGVTQIFKVIETNKNKSAN